MPDRLKKFIDENREAFDSEMPDPAILSRLQGELNGSPVSATLFPVRRAVAVALLVIGSALCYFFFRGGGTASKTTEDYSRETISVPDPLYAQQIDKYRELIGIQQTQLREAGKDHPELYQQFEEDINRLDSSYRVLKNTLEDNPNTELLLEEMIRNLQLQSDLLNRQLLIVKEIKQKSKT